MNVTLREMGFLNRVSTRPAEIGIMNRPLAIGRLR